MFEANKRKTAGMTLSRIFSHSVVGAMLLAAGMGAQAQDTGPIKVGMIFPKQGPSAAIGEFLSRGALLAVEERGGKVGGRDIEVVFLDEPNAQQAQQNFQKLVEERSEERRVGKEGRPGWAQAE